MSDDPVSIRLEFSPRLLVPYDNEDAEAMLVKIVGEIALRRAREELERREAD